MNGKKVDDLIYEDDDYYITSLDFGEWGGCTWFMNKTSGKQYELAATTPIINRLDGKYLVTTGKAVYQITEPQNLKESDSPYLYDSVVGNLIGENSFHAPCQSHQGAEVIFEDTSSWWESKFHIASSFILNNQLYHLCADSGEAYIGVVEEQVMKPVYHFPIQLDPMRRHYHYRNRVQNNQYQTIQFRTGDKQWLGMIEFDREKITITYMHNTHNCR